MSQALGPEARALLARARQSREPSMADRWAVRRSLAARIGAASTGAAAGVATTKAGATLLGGAKLSLLSQFGIAAVAGATIATSAMLVPATSTKTRTLQPPTVSSSRPSNPLRFPSQDPPVTLPSPSPSVAPPPRPATHDAKELQTDVTSGLRSVSPRAKESKPNAVTVNANGQALTQPIPHSDGLPVARKPLLDEGRALAQVQRALSEHRGADALHLLELQSREFDRGSLAPERAAARVIALCDVGKRLDARSAAERFAQDWPDSPLLGRVLVTCK